MGAEPGCVDEPAVIAGPLLVITLAAVLGTADEDLRFGPNRVVTGKPAICALSWAL